MPIFARLPAIVTTALALSLAGPLTPTAVAQTCPGNPNALGTSRAVEIDTTDGPGFGLEQYRSHDFLQSKEIVLTFDDGPWLNSTKAVLEALASHCVKATFFAIGKHALYYPEILKEVAAKGHTIGTHTWSHVPLNKLGPDKGREEIEKGISAVKLAIGQPPASFFRFPALQDPPEQLAYLSTRNIAIFSHDVDSFDFKFRKPDEVIKSVTTRLEKKGKGIVLLHDFQAGTAKALPQLLTELKARGYKVVHLKSKSPVASLPEYDAAVQKELKNPAMVDQKPTSSIIKSVPIE
jgi:peptidoglycan/xylan/chitin deacetylase (PgdA/CDA1 family)